MLAVDVFGYGPDYAGGVGFVQGLPGFANANGVQISLVQPLDKKILGQEVFPVAEGTGKVPEVTYGDRLRLDFDVTDTNGSIVATGSSPMFDFDPDLERLTFRIQVGANNTFSPYGSVVRDASGERRYAQSRYDYRGTSGSRWLGSIGHGAVTLSDGTIVIIGGGDPIPGFATTALPDFRFINNTVQTFEVRTGYFTDISVDDASGTVNPEDKLFQPTVWPSVTPIGNDRFLVTGGFTGEGGRPIATDTIQIVDVKAPATQRVQRLRKADGSFAQLKIARGRHAAAFRGADNSVVVIGGLGVVGENDVLDSFEVIKLDTGEVSGPFTMQSARVEATATAFDGSKIWVVGGRNQDGVLATSEVISADNTSAADATLRTARFGHAVVRLTPGLTGNLLMVIGGYVDADGNATGNFEIGGLGRGVFQSGSDWEMSVGRGRPSVAELVSSNDIIVIGGRDANADQKSVDRLKYVDLNLATPYTVQGGGNLTDARYMATATVGANGKVFLIGGIGPIADGVAAADSALIYNALDPVSSGAQIVE
ncbi:MAG: hypothetical protein R3E66_15850 [bacterium]